MKPFVLMCALFVSGCSAKVDVSAPMPPADKPSAARLITASAKATAAVSGSEGAINDDERFVVKLKEVLRDGSLSSQDKVEAFYLMLRAVGWAFNGSMMLPGGVSYHDYCGFQIATYYKWHVALSSEGFSGAEFIQLAERKTAGAEPLAAYSVLLAGILDADKMEPAAKQFLVNANESTPLLLRSAIIAAALTRSEEMSAELGATLERVKGEEALEDLICALSVMSTYQSYRAVSGFVMDRATRPFDQEVETGIHAMRAHMDPETFAKFYTDLLSHVSDPTLRQKLTEFRDRNFAYSLTVPGTAIKIWDGFGVTVYDDGYSIESKSSLDFVPDEKGEEK